MTDRPFSLEAEECDDLELNKMYRKYLINPENSLTTQSNIDRNADQCRSSDITSIDKLINILLFSDLNLRFPETQRPTSRRTAPGRDTSWRSTRRWYHASTGRCSRGQMKRRRGMKGRGGGGGSWWRVLWKLSRKSRNSSVTNSRLIQIFLFSTFKSACKRRRDNLSRVWFVDVVR